MNMTESRLTQIRIALPSLDGAALLPLLATGTGMVPSADVQDDPIAEPPRGFPAWAIAAIVGVFLLVNLSIFGWYVCHMDGSCL